VVLVNSAHASIPVVILCGGQGTRFREETQFRPKPLIPVGPHPILWHVMQLYAARGFTSFVLCLGYKGDMIKDWFLRYDTITRDFAVRLGEGVPEFLSDSASRGWRVTLVDTGATTMTGARLKRVEKYIEAEHFMVTYADGVADIDVRRLVDFHLAHGKIGTVTGVRPALPFGQMALDGTRVTRFAEKPLLPFFINGGFFVFHRRFLEYLDADESCVLEQGPLERLAVDGELQAFLHLGFWQCVDTPKDQMVLEELWRSGAAPWRPTA
jgi:glucose-1-phosphate cytidylyltransferase